jgi:steroid 5-alpha reductase family enzyme
MSNSFDIWYFGLIPMLVIGLAGWIASLIKSDVSIVDSLWSLMFLAAASVYLIYAQPANMRSYIVYGLVAVWALRLSIHITIRNWGESEDHRYVTIRNNREPWFEYKSLYFVFGLQALLAWIISLPIFAAITISSEFSMLDAIACVFWLIGFSFQAVADYQLLRFKSDPANSGKVLARGAWRYSRHPNYFGECLIWWGFYLFALSSGAWWSVISPVLITFLLLRISGVAMMEGTITKRRPEYQAYISSTNAFIPWFPKTGSPDSAEVSK